MYKSTISLANISFIINIIYYDCYSNNICNHSFSMIRENNK